MRVIHIGLTALIALALAGALALLSSCVCACPTCPDNNGETQDPVGWFAQTAPNEESYFGLHVFDANTAVAVGSGGFIIRTTDGGDTWSVVSSGSTDRLHRVSFVGDTGWAVGLNSVILKSTDAGLTWTPQDAGVTTHFRSVHFVDENVGWVAASPWSTPDMDGYVLKTSDDGDSWTFQTCPTTVAAREIMFADENAGWIVGYYGTILRTVTGGWN